MADHAKLERCEKVNALIQVISYTGRSFFRHKDRVFSMSVDSRGRVWFTDAYTGRRIYTHYHGRWRGFTEGGTLHALVYHLRDFIKDGTTLPSGILGPWPQWICGGDLWGYGEDMEKVRQAAREAGLIDG